MHAFRRILAPLAALGLAAGLLTIAQAPASATSPAVAPSRVVVNPIQKIQRYNLTITVSGATQAEHPTQGWGTVPSGSVTLQRKYAGTSTWRTIQSDATAATFRFNVRAIQNASYRVVYSGGSSGSWVFPKSTSANRWLTVRRNLNDYLSRRGGFYIKGDMNPGGNRYVFIERKTCNSCAWKGWKKVRSGAKGKFSVRLSTPRRGTHQFRAHVKANTQFTRSPGNKIYRVTRY